MAPPNPQDALTQSSTVKLKLPDELGSYEKSIGIFDTIAQQNSLNDQAKLAILFNAISSNGNYSKIEPFLQQTIATYAELKGAVLQASRAYSGDDYALLYSPTRPEPLKAYQTALNLAPTAKDTVILDMIRMHLTPQVYLQIKYNTAPADEPKEGKLRDRLVDYIKVISPESLQPFAQQPPSTEIARLQDEVHNLKKAITVQQSNHQINAIRSAPNRPPPRTRVENGECGYHIDFGVQRSFTCMPQCKHFDPNEFSQALPNGAFKKPRRFGERSSPYQRQQANQPDQQRQQQQQHHQSQVQSEATNQVLKELTTQISGMGNLLAQLTEKISKN